MGLRMARKEKEPKPWVLTDRRIHNLKVARKAKSIYTKMGEEAYIRKFGHPYRSKDG
jgi:hypothetical protein